MSDIDVELEELIDTEAESDDTGPDLRVRWRDQIIDIRVSELTGLDYARYRQATGQNLTEAMRARGLDAVAGLVWLRLARGNQKLKYATVAREITWDHLIGDDDDA